jgi:thioredoxin reductase (NADPH)
MPISIFDVIVIGNGIAGLTAGKEAAQAGLVTASIESALFGGLVINVNELDGMPAGEKTSGYRVASRLKMENVKAGVATLTETVKQLDIDGEYMAVTTDAARHHARAVVIASGAKLKRLGIPGEAKFVNHGVSQCVDCDGPFYKGKDTVVVGGGDSALQGALMLSKQCRHVYVVHRGARFRARQHLVDAVQTATNIEPVWNTVADRVLGDASVFALRVRGVTDESAREIPCSGLFAYVGLTPNCDFAPTRIRRDANGYLITNEVCHTDMPGVYAVGAVRSGNGGLLTDAMMDAQVAIGNVKSFLQ